MYIDYIITYSSQYGLTFVRNEENLFLPIWGNANGTTWIKRMPPNGGNKNQGNYGINGKPYYKIRLSTVLNNNKSERSYR